MNVLEVEPELADGMAEDQREIARQVARARVRHLREGPWWPWSTETGELDGGVGLLVLEGLLARRVKVGGRHSVELLGAGDLFRPSADLVDAPEGASRATWTVLREARVAVLDRRFHRTIGRWPEVTSALFMRLSGSSHALAVRLAIAQEPKLKTRLSLLLWELAERWGRVQPDGVLLPFRLSHEVLAELACAQRPSVSVALRELAQQREVTKCEEGWLLRRDPLEAERAKTGRSPRHAPRARASGGRLSKSRRAVYVALVEAVGSSPGTLVDPAAAERAADELAAFYAAASHQVRDEVDAVLDRVVEHAGRGPFTAMSAPERVVHLRKLLASTAAPATSGTGGPGDVERAIALAAAPFDRRGFHWSVASVELWLTIVGANRPAFTFAA